MIRDVGKAHGKVSELPAAAVQVVDNNNECSNGHTLVTSGLRDYCHRCDAWWWNYGPEELEG